MGVEKLRLAVLGGTGFADRPAVPHFLQSQKVEIVAVQARDEERVRVTAERHGIPLWTTDVDEILAADHVDAVYIASPVFLHASQTVAAAQAGKHVLCEKPMALTAAECEQMIAACKEADVVLMPAFMLRFNPAPVEIKKLLENGEIGQVITLKAQFGFWYPPGPGIWRQVKRLSGGGALADVGSHAIDLLRFLAGEVVSVAAHTATLTFDYDVDDVSTLLMRFASGSIGFVDAYFNARRLENRLEIVGTEGTIIAETLSGSTRTQFRVLRRHRTDYYDLPKASHYVAEVEHFAKCVAEGTQPEVTGEDGLKCQQIIEAAFKSAETGAVVKLA